MKISILQENLLYGLKVVSRAIPPRSTIPVLSNVLITTENGRLRLSATNLELGVTCWVDAEIKQEGSITVPARSFTDLITTLPKHTTISMQLDMLTQTLNIHCGSLNTNIKGIDVKEFPPMPVPDLTNGIQIDAIDLKEAIQRVVFATTTDESRQVLNGVQLNVAKNRMTFSATDGYRLSVRILESPISISQSISIIIPAKSLTELTHVINDDQIVTMIYMPDKKVVVFHLDTIELSSQIIEGTYPDIDYVIPKSHTTRAILSTVAFLDACKQLIKVAGKDCIARINVIPDDKTGKVEISTKSDNEDDIKIELDASVEGSGLQIGFKTVYLRDALNAVDTPDVIFDTTTSNNPCVIRPTDDNNSIQVIMPCYLNESPE